MDEVKRLLTEEIERINREEKRDNKIRFSRKFMQSHPHLFAAMLVSYVPVAIILFYAPYFGLPYLIGFTVFLLVMTLALSVDINPIYRFEDIDTLDLRVCYNGEWFTVRHVSQDTQDKLLCSEQVPSAVKAGIEKIRRTKGDVDFYDVFSLAYHQQPSR
ncbi:YlaC family protein [Pectobacterium polaris]|uniref:YlaC family protein n=1 Tax=Pectobacterium polaris TaxID=2042057 RepID=UPI0020C67570|nr:YlaC family protein [Pectobacterium polaris]